MILSTQVAKTPKTLTTIPLLGLFLLYNLDMQPRFNNLTELSLLIPQGVTEFRVTPEEFYMVKSWLKIHIKDVYYRGIKLIKCDTL